MATVYKYGKRSLEYTVPLLIVILELFEFIALTSSSTKGHIRTLDYSEKDNYPKELFLSKPQEVERKRLSDLTILPKRHPNITIVRAQARSNASMNCNISEIQETENATLFWYKKWENNELFKLCSYEQMVETNITFTYWSIDDKRFMGKVETTDWSLHIRYTKMSDAGEYQCQVCHDLPSTKCSTTNVILKLVDAHAKIIGGPRKLIPSDKELPLRLSCVLINSIEAPSYIFWYHGDRMINYDLEDGATVREGPQGSELIFPKPNKTHVGNYSCVPSNAKQDSVMVYYGDDASVHLENGSGGEKTHPGDHVVNMLVLMSTFHLTR